jgi:hypothetical protein
MCADGWVAIFQCAKECGVEGVGRHESLNQGIGIRVSGLEVIRLKATFGYCVCHCHAPLR